MARREVGITQRGTKWRAFVRVDGTLLTKSFDLTTPRATIRAWRDAQVPPTGLPGSFEADVLTYLGKPTVAAMASFGERRAHLELWLIALGRDRRRATITTDEIEAVLQGWLRQGLSSVTVYHRRTALLSLYTTLDGPGAANPVRQTHVPKAWNPKDQAVPYATLARIVEAMPTVRYVKKGIQQPAMAALVARVIIAVGMRAVDLRKVRRTDLDWTAGTVRWPASGKGKGVASRVLPLTAEGLAAFRAFDAANAYGRFSPEAVSHAFKRAARRIDGPDTTIHLYSLRHSLGTELYRETRDLATVGRLLGHAPGSRVTPQYASGANADVDRAAVAALSRSRTPAAAVPESPKKLPEKLPRRRKQRAIS
jgi:integrase